MTKRTGRYLLDIIIGKKLMQKIETQVADFRQTYELYGAKAYHPLVDNKPKKKIQHPVLIYSNTCYTSGQTNCSFILPLDRLLGTIG